MIIYKTTNLINNKIYIGKDCYNNPKYLGSGLLLNKAIKKYGKGNFKKEIIEHCSTKEHLNEREIYWIEYYNSRDSNIGYNIAKGGHGGFTKSGYKHSEESRKCMKDNHWSKKGKSAWNKGLTKEVDNRLVLKNATKEKLKKSLTGIKRSTETKQKLSKALKGRIPWNKGKKGLQKLSLDARKKISDSKRGKVSWMKGRKHTEESKEKNRQAHLKTK